ncbi:Flp pilus assembly complex ATPase component TadA [Alkalibacter rhizosphaerae]|uniref:Flp pilus assembly complex ATPase component TadA n=1 Tax=Alkalibacter rhizosphaerae TaxID=2815577 RepID=A0A974XF16_9FIRM|nr:ATPase, T2SS/T4P/T4SS family [Alkalibacter rhizosphaerae]QSX08657.1 Flp pilus assembly complex ATPase component TadA [Alkalibacter rhizosphaerae]
MRSVKRIGDILVSSGKLTEEQLTEAIKLQQAKKNKLGELLVEEGYVDEDDIIEALKQQLGISRVDFENTFVDKEAVKSIPYVLAKKHVTVPLFYDTMDNLVVAINDPLDIIALDNLRLVTKKHIIPLIATKREIIDLIERFYNTDDAARAVEEFNRSQSLEELDQTTADNMEQINNAPVVRLVNNIIETGVRSKASDIHIEPFADRIRVRMRVDGVLLEMMKLDVRTHNAIVSRIKIISDLNIAERRIPQDGAIVMRIDNRDIDFRVSILPTIYGEKVVIRILDQAQFQMRMSDLGFTEKEMPMIQDFISAPYGIILVTGPTGSGKSTTLYTLIRNLNTMTDNIVTVEDPVEYKLDGINQVQVNVKAGLTFVSGLRSILRQDPDIIMIGEIRDVETAEIAIRSSITGHLVFSTIHTNDAASTISRLVDMGIPPYLVSSSLYGIISQRLIRKLCVKCKEEYEPNDHEKKMLGVDPGEKIIIFKPKGCIACNNTGYKGRMGIHEVLKINRNMREMITTGATYDQLLDQAKADGMIPLMENARDLILQGVTSIEETLEITFFTSE